MKSLIVNADDFGLTEAVSQGIIKAFREGIVTSTTLMVNMPACEKAVYLAKQNPELEVGLHLNLTCGRPVLPPSEVPSLVDEQGNFHRRPWDVLNKGKAEEMKKELETQVEKFNSTGLELTHLDSHHHLHLHPKVFSIFLTLAEQHGIPFIRLPNDGNLYEHELALMRSFAGNLSLPPALQKKIFLLNVYRLRRLLSAHKLGTTDYFIAGFGKAHASETALSRMLWGLKEGVTELMCHPGIEDEELRSISSYTTCRENELAALTSPRVRQAIEDLKIKKITFRDLAVKNVNTL